MSDEIKLYAKISMTCFDKHLLHDHEGKTMGIPKSKRIRMLASLLFLSLLVLLASQFLFPSVLAQEDFGEIVVGVPAHFPPQYYVDDETGEPYGFAIDVMDEIAEKSGLKIRYVVFDTWPEVTEAMQKEEIDVIPNSGVVAERDANSNYTANVEVFTIGIITRTSTMDIHSIDDLPGHHVAVVSLNKGFYIMEEHEDVDLHVYNSLEEAFYSLISGDTDALVYPNEQVIRIAIQLDIEDQIKVVGEPLLEVKRAIAVRKDQTELFDVLDKEVKAFVATPEYGEIYAKWYGEPEPYWNVKRVATAMGTVLVLVVLCFAGWHYYSTLKLNKELKISVSKRKFAEEKLQTSEKLLDETQRLTKVGGWEYDVETKQFVWTDETYSIHEIPNDPEIDHISESVKCYRPEDRPVILGAFQRAIEKGEPYDMEFRFTTFRNNQLWIRTTAKPIFEGGKVVRIVGNIIDITERKLTDEKNKKSAEELAKAYEELKSLDKMKDEFLSNVSHELKTPLVSIEGYSEVLSDCTLGELNDKQKKAVDTVMRNAKRLERLIDSILYLSIEEAGRMQYTFKPLQIVDIIEKSVSDMLPQIKKKNLTIKKEVQDNLPLIQADEDRIMQVMINLIGNAIKFTSSGEIVVKVYVGEDDDNLHIEVNDTGVGIPKEHIDNLFDRFYQGDSSTKRKYGGTGLGLHICKLIVEAHNGKIWAESDEEVGTTIHFTLPK